MTRESGEESAIVETWIRNGQPWVGAVRTGAIASRKEATDAAIVAAVTGRSPKAVPHLIEEARASGGGDFRVLAYDQLASRASEFDVDLVVCNFSLFGEASTEVVFRAAAQVLDAGGFFVVQTLHPVVACGDHPYRDGWREGSWSGLGPGFSDPAPWYFRTLESWVELFTEHGFGLIGLLEPVGAQSSRPASVIFVSRRTHACIRQVA